MSTPSPIETRWADQLAPLDAQQRRAVVQALANGMHEGWEPTAADITRLVDYARGAVGAEEYKSDALARARRDG